MFNEFPHQQKENTFNGFYIRKLKKADNFFSNTLKQEGHSSFVTILRKYKAKVGANHFTNVKLDKTFNKSKVR